MSENNNQNPLYVDLDGTLIKTDLLFEGLFLLLRKNPLWIFAIPVWLLRGRAKLKAEIAKRTEINVELLPVNEEFLAYLQNEKANGRSLILISASDQQAVDRVGEQFQLFEQCIGSDGTTNLKSRAKLARIKEMSNGQAFAYAGNSSADISVWAEADEVIRVNCSNTLGAASLADKQATMFDQRLNTFPALWRALRPHQWLKNGLLFIPLVLAHQLNELHLLEHAATAFICFSLTASSVYLLNDLLDLESDRKHATKRNRPLASGELPIQLGLLMVPTLLVLAILIAHLLPVNFIAALGVYWLLTLLYSFVLKRLFLLDVVTLSGLYTLRLVAGAAAVHVQASPWLLAFSMSLFLGLAVVKRVTELANRKDDNEESLPGRAYANHHLKFLSTLGVIASALAVLIFAFYINADETMMLYSSPITLWPICGLLFLVLFRIWSFAIAGELQDDPVLFAISDRPSQIATVLMFVILWMAI